MPIRDDIASSWRRAASGLLIAFAAVLGGCTAVTTSVVIPPAPLYDVQAATWQAINEQILSASVYARQESEAYARITMNDWIWLVRRRTEDVFIPWYSSYWTQKWLANRVVWYKMQYTEGEVTPEEQLVSYLQQQFYVQVLEPVSVFVDPHTVMEEATSIYLRELKDRLEQLPLEHRIPVAALNQYLKSIPAIVVLEKPLHNASLYEVLLSADLSALPAYETLLAQIAAVNGGIDPALSADGLDRVARKAVTELTDQITLSGGATAASVLVGGFLGILISAGAETWNIREYEQDKPVMVAQLRDNLDMMLDVMWQGLVEDSRGGVNAVVHHMSTQIEYTVFTLDPAGSRLF